MITTTDGCMRIILEFYLGQIIHQVFHLGQMPLLLTPVDKIPNSCSSPCALPLLLYFKEPVHSLHQMKRHESVSFAQNLL
jgi:hypothetical protein